MIAINSETAMRWVPDLDLERDGAQLFAASALGALDRLDELMVPERRAGVRLFGIEGLQHLLSNEGAIGAVASSIRPGARPVRAILFDKSPGSNWPVGWHQDRTISVAERCEVEGFGPWTVKSGIHHVAPPIDLLARMVTLRVHFDDVPATNAPLLIAPGSHRVGRVPEERIEQVVRRLGTMQCLAQAGDVWVYATPILHASRPALEPRHRRVLQVDYSADDLPGGLRWLGV